MESLPQASATPGEAVAETVGPETIAETGRPENGENLKPADCETHELEEISILAVRDTGLFPNALLPLSVGRPTSVALVESLGENRLIGVVSQIDPRTDVPGPSELHGAGTIAMIHKIVRMREGQ